LLKFKVNKFELNQSFRQAKEPLTSFLYRSLLQLLMTRLISSANRTGLSYQGLEVDHLYKKEKEMDQEWSPAGLHVSQYSS
jgi:hypothetical protein